MQNRVLRWLATPAAIAMACAAGAWLYLVTAFGIGLGAGLRCLFRGDEAGTCITTSESVRFWSWTVASGVVSGIASVLLAVFAAPAHRSIVRFVATLVPPLAWLWFGSWNFADPAAVVLAASSLGGGLFSWLMLSHLVAMTPNTSLERTRDG
jgi:hypothetical protein